jgi:peptidoglycan/xylan/chitin deacetylase (PgdA/CDA1 family)
MYKTLNIIFLVCFLPCQFFIQFAGAQSKPSIALSFDDGSIASFAGYPLEEWNELLLSHLTKHGLKSVLFSTGKNKRTVPGQYILRSWDLAGHFIGNHTYSHPNFNNKNITLNDFKMELLRNDSIIRGYSHYWPFFRFPYLKEGNTPEKINGFRQFMAEKGYKNGHVSIDASDWYIDSRLVKRLNEHPDEDLNPYKQFYIQHLYQRALYYDSLGWSLTGRHIRHVLLLHHNLSAALFLDELIQYFKDHGWEIVDIDKAYEDPIYQETVDNVPAGESLIWALAKKSGKFNLRYPAEDSSYEQLAMDALKL